MFRSASCRSPARSRHHSESRPIRSGTGPDDLPRAVGSVPLPARDDDNNPLGAECPVSRRAWTADRGYAADLVCWARERLRLTLHIVSRPRGTTKSSVVLPRHWLVERAIGWCINACRNARDYERLPSPPKPI